MGKIENKNYKILTPFKGWVLQNFPFIEADFDALTNYELICKITENLNNIIYNQNEVQDLSVELVKGYNDLLDYVNNYLDHLDIQTDVNNKLDEMAKSGQLTDIIAQYLGLAGMITFNNVAEMKEAQNLVNGSKCCTLGFHNANDGGSAIYKVRNVTNDDVVNDMDIIELYDDNLVAELINLSNTINPCKMGAYHDGTHDDSTVLQYCLELLHAHNFKILDLQGYSYYINKPLYLDSTYNATIKNGEIIALSNFTIDVDTTKNYLLYTTDTINTTQQGSFGYAQEDLLIKNIKFDAQLITGLGCLNLKNYLRISIDECYFRRYKTHGIYVNDATSHELVVTNSSLNANLNNETNKTGIGLYLYAYDNIFSNLIITGGQYCIYLTNSKANEFSKIHTYGSSSYGIYMTSSSQNTFDQMYIDGKGVYMYIPWLTTFNNCYFLVNSSPITLDRLAASTTLTIDGLKFNGCTCVNFDQVNTIDAITYPNGEFYTTKNCIFDITFSGLITDNTSTCVGFAPSQTNKVFLNSESQTLLLNSVNDIVSNTNFNLRYTGTIINNVVDITAYDSTGYNWAGIVIPLQKNTNYKTINHGDHTQDYKVLGFANLDNNTRGTQIKAENIYNNKYKIFNSGDYKYYVIAFYGKKVMIPEFTIL